MVAIAEKVKPEMILRVRCPSRTFRRSGLVFSPAWVVVDHTQLSDEQIRAIEGEPLLAHEWLEPATTVEPAAEPTEKGRGKKA